MSIERSQNPPKWKAPFFSVWGGQAISLIGSNLLQFALVWWLTKTTGSATVLATATLVALLPGVFLGPFAGALVDRWNRRAVMIVADTVTALTAVWLAYLFWAGAVQLWQVYLILFIRSLAGTFQFPAMQASTSLMVPERHLSRVAGLNQSLYGIMGIVSPPLGALLLTLLPIYGIMAVDVVTAACAVTILLLVHIPQPPRQAVTAGVGVPSVWADVRAGLRYVAGWPGLLIILVMATVINFVLNPAMTLMPLLVTQHFGGGAFQLGWLESAWGLGMVIGGLILGVWGGFRRRVVTSLLGLIGMGLGFLLVGLTPAAVFGLAVGALFLAGFMNPMCNGPLFAIVQAKVAPEMQGRVFTVMGSAAGAASPIAMLIAGPVADRFGVRLWYVMGGIVCVVMAVIALSLPSVMHMEDKPAAAGVPASDGLPAAAGE